MKHSAIFLETVKGQERAIVCEINIGSVSKAMLEKHLRDEVECMIVGSSEHIDLLS